MPSWADRFAFFPVAVVDLSVVGVEAIGDQIRESVH